MEFTQIDMELFVDVDDVIEVNERLLAKIILKKFLVLKYHY